MTSGKCVSIAAILVVLVTGAGCKGKQENAPAGTAATQNKTLAPPAADPAPDKAGAAAAPDQDMAAARAAALRVLALMEAGDFAAIYRNASPSFKQIGSEQAFVTKFQQTRNKTGVLKNPKELKFDTRPDKVYVLVYRVDNQHFTTEMRLSFERAQNGAMELVGLNQHDEPKK